MKHKIKSSEHEIINFVMARLQNFKRIHFESLTEVINSRFSMTDINSLLHKCLIKTNKAELKRGYLIIAN